jgi:lysozyme family protein
MTDRELLDRLLAREGSAYVADPADRGGCSRYGITRPTLADWRGVATVSCEDVRAVTATEARAVYAARFLAPYAGVQDWRLREVLFDAAVHHGPGRATRWLQQALGVEDDGRIGPLTLAALATTTAEDVRRGVVRRRLWFLGDLIARDPTQAKWASGWLRRVGEFL